MARSGVDVCKLEMVGRERVDGGDWVCVKRGYGDKGEERFEVMCGKRGWR